MSRADYCPNTAEEIRAMLDVVGVGTIEDLFQSIPGELRSRSLDIPAGLSEFGMLRRMKELAGKNGSELINFIGGGFYDHFIPSVVDHLSARAEFYTSYTPYQAECSQGTLQALYEYQSAICALTGMEVSNASLYDGGTALAEAALMAMRITGRSRLIVDGGVNPYHRQILRTYLSPLQVDLEEMNRGPATPGSGAAEARLDDTVAAVIMQNPDFFGSIDDIGPLAEKAHALGALVIVSAYPISLGLVKSPGEIGADIVTGDGQSLGNPLSFGGPSFGFISTLKRYVRSLPGRIVGETVDSAGRRGFVLTLQAREQHIKRHRATSNICSNQSLCALRGLIFLCCIGRQGMKELAALNRDKSEYAKGVLGSVRGVSVLNAAPTFNEFTLALPCDAAAVAEKLLARKIAPGVPLGNFYPEMKNCLVVAVTEKRAREEIDAYAAALEEALWS